MTRIIVRMYTSYYSLAMIGFMIAALFAFAPAARAATLDEQFELAKNVLIQIESIVRAMSDDEGEVLGAEDSTISNSATIKGLQKMMIQLQAQVALLNNKNPQSISTVNPNLKITQLDDDKGGKPKIVLTAPNSKKSTFNKSDPSDPIVISWLAYNVPASTNLVVDLTNVKVRGGVGGGSAQFKLPTGDSKGTYKWDIHSEGRTSAGRYRVQVGLEECSSMGCNFNAHFPGREEDVTLYAQSASKGVKVVGTSPTASPTQDASITTIDDSDTPYPTFTGVTKSGITTVGFSIGQGDKIYGSGPIPVLNNRWSQTVTEEIATGTYTVSVYVNSALAEKRSFKITN